MRYTSIDLLRTFAIVVMVYVHFCENLAGITPSIAGFGAPLFMFLSGLSYHLWLCNQVARQRPDDEISKITIRRGLFLFALGVAFNIVVWLPEDTFNWDVLTLVGSAMLLLNVIRYWPSWLALMLSAGVLIISPVARQLADWPSYWAGGYYDPHMRITDVALGYLVTGYFPILPWIAYPVLGWVTGRELFGQLSNQRPSVVPLRRGIYVGACLFALSYLIPLLTRSLASSSLTTNSLVTSETKWTMFPNSSVYFLGSIGFAIAAFCGLFWWMDERHPESWPRMRAVVATFSRYSLTAYLLHHIAHVWPLWITGTMLGTDTTYYWRHATTISMALVLATLYLPLSYLFLRWLERTNRRSVEHWMRWLCD